MPRWNSTGENYAHYERKLASQGNSGHDETEQ